LACAAIALCGAWIGVSSSASAATPLDGDGMWIWVLSASGGSAGAVADQAERYGIDVVFVKSGDGDDYWSQFSKPFVDALHSRGLKVCAWQFVYGSDPKGEARAAVRAVEAGADCFVIDAETNYEGRYAQAQTYVRKIRAQIPDHYPLALTSFPYVDYHPTFPYSVFLAPGAAQYNVPQMYWHTIGVSVASNFDHTYRYNRPYGSPIYPLGQTYDGPPKDEVIDFRRNARAYEAPGISWWSWQATEGKEWNWVSRKLGPQQNPPRTSRGYAVLASGSSGDLVIWAQQHLNGAGFEVKVDGTYGKGTASIVSEFQQDKGLNPTGTVNAKTWKALLKHQPKAVRWTERRSNRMAVAMGRDPFAAPQPELPLTNGRP
jgi:hypothetical protein